ncbi:MAG: 50S ribosomal protein L22 [Nanoarchaeota archaeon]|nr:50S ribosomal protein L22 [Nanoarchaeota archaeon]
MAKATTAQPGTATAGVAVPTTTAGARAAHARALSVSISTKQSVEISHALRYRNTAFAKRYLEEVAALRRAVPFRRYNKDMGHKPGMAAGRYPQKAAQVFLQLVRSVEANAQVLGLDTSNLKITKLLANKASIPVTGGRRHRGTKRTHLEIEVQVRKAKGTKQQRRSRKEKPNAPQAAQKNVKESTA